MINILIGIAGLGLVVFVHELGHFLAAKLMGIRVKAFSIGWGKPILHKTIKGVDYRLGMFPIGGYCQMDGDDEYKEALANGSAEIRRTPGTFWGEHPLKRIVVSFMGSFFNWIFAVLVLAIISIAGYTIYTQTNRIILASEINPGDSGAADRAGLETGDIILAIDGTMINSSQDVTRIISENPGKNLTLSIDRDGERREIAIQPELDRNYGAGRIGVYFWSEPVIGSIAKDSPADFAGLKPGDRILEVQGETVEKHLDFHAKLMTRPNSLRVRYERNAFIDETDLVFSWTEGLDPFMASGIAFQMIEQKIKETNPLKALGSSVLEVNSTLVGTFKSLGVLFKGINLGQAVSGPLRITHMVGEQAVASFQDGAKTGFISLFRFLAIISIVIALMNMLPIPALDGGMIVVFIIEMIRRRPINTRILYRYQLVGTVIIMALLVFTLISDAFFLFR